MSTNEPEAADAGSVVEVTSRAEDVADRLEQDDASLDEAADAIRDLAGLVGALSDDVRALQDWKEQNQSAVAYAGALEAQSIASQVKDLQDDAGEVVEQPTTIQQFAAMPPEARDALGPSDRRAAFLFENFSDWAKKPAKADGPVVSTATGQDGRAKLKQLLESKLQEHGFDQDGLAWNEVYRAMKMVARKSGGEKDDITDGAFTYIPNWSNPWTDGDETAKVLILDDPDQLQFDPLND